MRAPFRASAYVAATAHFAFNEPRGFEQFIGCRDGRAVQSKLASQFSSWREPVTGTKIAAFDQILEIRAQLAIQRYAGVWIEVGPDLHQKSNYTMQFGLARAI